MKFLGILLSLIAVSGRVVADEDCYVGFENVEKTKEVTHILPEGDIVVKNETYTEFQKICCGGYLRSEQGNCDIIRCENCENGFCDYPDTCECNPGFIKHRSGKCISESTTTPKTTTINHSYTVTTSAPNICGEDYVYNLQTSACEPFCESCINGNCTSPRECTCLPGHQLQYESNDVQKCIPICEQSCENGYCASPNECQCDAGYEQSNQTDIICEPVCEKNCTFGDCISPNVCQCYPDYIWNDQIGGCELKTCTSESCKNGFCDEALVCNCNRGYEMNSTDQCEPRCSAENCRNGNCTEEGDCDCYEGYQNVSRSDNLTECVPICKLNCQNGTQLSAESCECIEAVSAYKDSLKWWFVAILVVVVLLATAVSIGIGLRMVQNNMQSGTYRVTVKKVEHKSRNSVLLYEEEAFV